MARVANMSRSETEYLPQDTETRQLTSQPALMERLEDRQLLSMTVVSAPVAASGTVLHEKVGLRFTADLGHFVTIAPGTNLDSSISWGDGTISKGTLRAIGIVGLDEIQFELDGRHLYQRAGVYSIQAVVDQPGPTPTTLDRLVARFSDTAIVTTGNVSLNGTISGTYLAAPTSITTGAEYIFNGTGSAGDLGPVAATGDVIIPSPLSTTTAGVATGTLTLTSISASPVNSGSVTLKLTAAPSSSAAGFPTMLHYVITGGTGAFAGATGEGTIAVTLGGANGSNAFTFVISSFLPPTPLA